MRKDFIPKETETIAARRAARVAEKLRKARGGLIISRAWWSSKLIDVLSIILLIFLNFYLIFPFLKQPAAETTFSGPLIPLVASGVEILGIAADSAYQVVNIFFFIAFPISYYLLIKKVAGRRLVALLTSCFVTLPVYPLARVRIEAAFLTVEGPHIASLAIIPLALYGLLSFLREGSARNLLLASVSSALVVLTSPFSFITYGLFSAVTAFSEMLLGRGRLKFFRFLVVFIFAAGLSSFWYNPAFFIWMITGPLGEEVRQTTAKLIPTSFFLVPALGAFGFLLFDRKPNLQPVFLAAFYTILFGVIVMAGGGFFPSHPSRYTPEFGMSLAFLLGVISARLVDYLKVQKTIKFLNLSGNAAANLLFVVTLLLLVVSIVLGRRNLRTTANEVLGLWTDVEKGTIWVERERFGGASSYMGYMITGVSVVGLSLIGVKTKNGVLGPFAK